MNIIEIHRKENIQLALELKNAGFKQKGKGEKYAFPLGMTNEEIFKTPRSEFAYIPTLSELIEACGEDLGSIIRMGSDLWICHPSWKIEKIQNYVFGSSPSEAVARLWLALNKK